MLWLLLIAVTLAAAAAWRLLVRKRATDRINRQIRHVEAESDMLAAIADILRQEPEQPTKTGPTIRDVEDVQRLADHRDLVQMESQRLHDRLYAHGAVGPTERARLVDGWQSFKAANPTPAVMSTHPSVKKVLDQVQSHLDVGDKVASDEYADDWAARDREWKDKREREAAERAAEAAAAKAAEEERIDSARRRSAAASRAADEDMKDRIRRHQEAQQRRESERGNPNPWAE